MSKLSQSGLSFAELRLRKHADYQRAYTAAERKQHAREMSFFCARRNSMPARRLHPDEATPAGPGGPRIGLTVGKVMGKAHDRNRIKRRLRAAVALHAGLLSGLPVDVILHPRRSVLLLDWDRLQREVANVFRTVKKQCAAAKPQAPAEPKPQPPAETRPQRPAQAKPQHCAEAEPQTPAETKPQHAVKAGLRTSAEAKPQHPASREPSAS